jgi:hypothetical protein
VLESGATKIELVAAAGKIFKLRGHGRPTAAIDAGSEPTFSAGRRNAVLLRSVIGRPIMRIFAILLPLLGATCCSWRALVLGAARWRRQEISK